MSEAPKESLKRIKDREREALLSALIQTVDNSYGRIDSGVIEYDEHLFPGVESIFDKIRAIHVKHPDRPVRILDFGCGTGRALRELKERLPDVPMELTGVSVGDARDRFQEEKDKELEITYLAVATDWKKKNSATFVAGEGEQYDLIVTRFTLQHIPDVFRALRGLYRSLTPDGVLHAHIGQFTGAPRFADHSKGDPDPDEIQTGDADFLKTIDELIDQGVQIEKYSPLKPAVLVIHKSKAQMKFPNLTYSLDGSHYGRVYRRTS